MNKGKALIEYTLIKQGFFVAPYGAPMMPPMMPPMGPAGFSHVNISVGAPVAGTSQQEGEGGGFWGYIRRNWLPLGLVFGLGVVGHALWSKKGKILGAIDGMLTSLGQQSRK
ncbi:MAG: hypothetical protein QXI58_00310 [Candidatus Micrarchaeia archaeon]